MVPVVSDGTSDMPVEQEAVLTAQAMGANVQRICDVSVSGLHRLLPHVENCKTARDYRGGRHGRRHCQRNRLVD